jgi:hypothetical protein
MADDLLSGNGSDAEFLNGTDAGATYVANQTPLDQIDNGTVTQQGGTTTVNSPSWTQSLASLFGVATQVASAVAPLTGKTNAPAAKVATPSAGGTASLLGMSTTTLLIIGGVVLALGALLFLGKRR